MQVHEFELIMVRYLNAPILCILSLTMMKSLYHKHNVLFNLDHACCKKIKVQSRFQDENMNLNSEVFKLQNLYPRVYKNAAGDTITRNGGICGRKEDIGYWMVLSFKIFFIKTF